jgi:hypothetical protein
MKLQLPKISEPPILWSIPFTLLLLTTFTALLDWLVPFISFNVEYGTWVWLAATLVTTIVTSIITEVVSSDKRRVLASMMGSALVFSFLYNDIVNVFLSGFMESVQGTFPYPIIGTAINTIILSILPGTVMGILVGGAISLIPKTPTLKKNELAMTTSRFYNAPPTFEKLCSYCDRLSPFEATYCSTCGGELTRQESPETKYCMYCGSKINYVGKYCPECGEEIDLASRAWKYSSNH